MKKIFLIPLLLIISGTLCVAQPSFSVQLDKYEAYYTITNGFGVVGSYSTENNLGKYVGIGTHYTKEFNWVINPIFSAQTQYMIGTYTQAPSFEFNYPQTEFEFVFSYSIFTGIAIYKFNAGVTLNHHFGNNQTIWFRPTIQYTF